MNDKLPDDVRVIDEVAESLSEFAGKPYHKPTFFAEILAAAQTFAGEEGKKKDAEIARLKTEVEKLKTELSDGDDWQQRAKDYLAGGGCPICFCSDEEGHTPKCLWGMAELEIARLKAEGKTQHDGDCTFYALMISGSCTDGICTCGFAHSKYGGAITDWFSTERIASMNPKGDGQ